MLSRAPEYGQGAVHDSLEHDLVVYNSFEIVFVLRDGFGAVQDNLEIVLMLYRTALSLSWCCPG